MLVYIDLIFYCFCEKYCHPWVVVYIFRFVIYAAILFFSGYFIVLDITIECS